MPSQITRRAVNLVDGQPDGSQKLESTARSLLISTYNTFAKRKSFKELKIFCWGWVKAAAGLRRADLFGFGLFQRSHAAN
jgi:hypothetical protein